MTDAVIRHTNCHYCGYLCALSATVEDGRVVDLEPDPTRYPYDDKIMQGCPRWKMNLAELDGRGRINHPLRRVGEKGSGQWEQISWDEALDEISSKLADLAGRYGPETLASAIGGPHATFWPLHRFMNLFGSPNNMGIGQICWNPRIWMDALTFGWSIEADIRPDLTGALIIWGTNPAQSDNSLFWRSLIDLSKTQTTITVIDPRFTQTARIADRWIAPKPGTDCALALGLINVIIAEDIYDHDFVDRWCHGFDELVEHVKPYTPEYVAEYCGISPDDILQTARTFAGPYPSALVSGRGVDQVGRNVAPTHRAITCLRAVTGNVDREGACVLSSMSSYTPESVMEMSDWMAPEQRARCLNTEFTPLQCYTGFAKVREVTEKLGRTLPTRYLTSAHPDLVWRAVLEGDPYPVRALIVMATNPLLTYADTHRVFRALQSLDLLVVLEQYMTPTAQMADYVLPSAAAIERPLFQAHGGVANFAYGGPAAVEPYYERKTDYWFFRELGLRLWQDGYWPQETLEEAYDAMLQQGGSSWEAFCRSGMYYIPDAYGKHELKDPETGEPQGFATISGKVELASEMLDVLGGPRLPSPTPPPSELLDETLSKGHRLTMITGARKQPYYASKYYYNEDFRKRYPAPLAEMSERTADELGFVDGDSVVVSTDKGEARFTLHVTTMRDGVVSVDYGWWFPEREPGLPDLGGIWESNVNMLTSCDVGHGEPMIGTWAYNALPCVIRKE